MTSQKFEFVQLWDLLAYPERARWKNPLAKNQPVSVNWWGDWIVTFTVQACFRRIYMESVEHDGAYISSPICTKRQIFSKWIFSSCSIWIC